MIKLSVVFLTGALALSALSCSGTSGSPTPGTGGGNAGATGAGGGGTSGTGGDAAGAAGTSGAAGTTGAAGTVGPAGAGGTSGTTGGGGAGTGSAGTTGAAGTSGGRGGAGGGAGASGSAGTGGGAGDPCATALFCDDFESYTAGQAPGGNWTRQVSSGSTAAVDTAQFRSGTKSVKFVAATGSGSKTAYIRLASTASKQIFPGHAQRPLRPDDVPPRIGADRLGALDVPAGQRPHRRARRTTRCIATEVSTRSCRGRRSWATS